VIEKNLSETLADAFPITKAPTRIPGHPSVGTVWRWTRKGCRGVRLQTWKVGGKRVTTDKAVDDFLARLNPQHPPEDRLDLSGSVVAMPHHATGNDGIHTVAVEPQSTEENCGDVREN